MTAPLVQSRFRVTGMDCASCAAKIEGTTLRIAGVAEAEVSVAAGTLVIRHAPDADLAPLAGRLSPMGYALAPLAAGGGQRKAHDHGESCAGHDHSDHDHAGHDHTGHDHAKHDHAETGGHDHGAVPAAEGRWWSTGKARLTLLSGLALVAASGIGTFVPAVQSWLFLAAMLVGLVPIARRAIAAAANGMPFTIEMLMTIAAAGAVVIGAAEEAAAVVFLFLVGELLEGVAAGRARASIRGLSGLIPKTARVETAGEVREVPAAGLMVGAIILVRPGDRIPADGEIVEGSGAIDESPVTGESVPKRKEIGDDVFAGTINTDAVLRVRVTAAASDNTISRIIRLVEEAQESKAPTERFIERFSRWYTPGVLVAGFLVAVIPPLVLGGAWSEWVYKGLAVLLIGCPCALVISTPAAIAAGLSAGARRGILLKGGAVLETLRKVTTVALDKTGTLTAGKPVGTNVVRFGRTAANVLSLAAALETGSSHPLAVAILAKAKDASVPVPPASAAKAIAGKGIAGKVNEQDVSLVSPPAAGQLDDEVTAQIAAFNDDGKTVSVLVVDGRAAGLIAMRDEPRDDAERGLAALRSSNIRTVMLTGDNERTAEAIASRLGIEVRAELLPDDKQKIVRDLQSEGHVVAKVGDGINDAPALAAADVGIAMGGGTDVALETADAALLHGRVTDVAGMSGLSHATMNNITQNIVISLGLKVVFLVTTIMGVTGLWPAILADTGATVLVTANAMRLLAWKPSA